METISTLLAKWRIRLVTRRYLQVDEWRKAHGRWSAEKLRLEQERDRLRQEIVWLTKRYEEELAKFRPPPSGVESIARLEAVGSRLGVDADGYVWWVHADGSHSMVMTNPDSAPTPMPWTFYSRNTQ